MAADEETSAAHYLDVCETPAVQFTLSAVDTSMFTIHPAFKFFTLQTEELVTFSLSLDTRWSNFDLGEKEKFNMDV